jgi:hypothetical protein
MQLVTVLELVKYSKSSLIWSNGLEEVMQINSFVSDPKRSRISPVRNSETSDSDADDAVESICGYSCDWKKVTEKSDIEAQLPFCYTETQGPKHIPSTTMTPN